MKIYLAWKRIKQHFLLGIANLPMSGHGIRPFLALKKGS